MRRRWKLVIGLFAFVIVVYAWGWGQSYFKSQTYFHDAEKNLKSGEVALALKGTPSNQGSGAGYQGGFEQVVDSWSSPWAIPKPSYYWTAKQKAKTIISNVTAGQAQSIVSTYINLDTQYLPEILLSLGNRSLKNGDISTAKQAFQTIIQAFSNDPSVVAKAKSQIQKIPAAKQQKST